MVIKKSISYSYQKISILTSSYKPVEDAILNTELTLKL